MKENDMCYVAADPNQPGTAWACCVDNPKYIKNTAKNIAQWARKGANIMRVDRDTAVEMLNKWVKPEKKKKLPLFEEKV